MKALFEVIKVNGTVCIEASVMPQLICVTLPKYSPAGFSGLVPGLQQEIDESNG
jgi:hypothetical protein